MSDAPQRITPLFRMAIWEAHHRKCVYENIPVAWDQLEIDHIIPQSIWRDIAKKQQIFEALDLDDDFSPHDLSNLIPCRSLRNGQKSDWAFDPNSVHFFRQLANEKKPEVKRWLAKLGEQQEQDRIRSSVEAVCDANPAVKEKLLAVLAATEPYPKEENICDDQVRLSRPRVLLNCFLPNDDGYGSLQINVNTLYLHRVQLTLDARQILGSLLRGWGTPPDLKQRGFIIGPLADAPGEWIVRIAGATIFLTSEELGQLCEVVDLLAPLFLKALLNRELNAGTLAFAPDGPDNVRLVRIKRSLWKAILDFAEKHDYAKGSSPWHIFDASGHGHIKIVRRTASGAVIPFETYIYPITPDEYGPKCEPLDEVFLCWEASMSRINAGDATSSGAGWTAIVAHHWLVEKLIPEVVRQNTPLLQRFRQWAAAGDLPRFHSETSGVNLDAFAPVQDWPALTRLAKLAQKHFSFHPHEPVCHISISSALSILALLADNLNVGTDHLDYYAAKLGVENTGTLSHRVAAARSNHAARTSFDGFDLDLVLRCVWGVLKDHAPSAGTQTDLFAQVSTLSVALIESSRWEVIRHRNLTRIDHTSTRI